MKVFVAQLDMTVGDFKLNREKIVASLARARAQGCALVLFPELAISGYPPQDLLLHPAFVEEMEVSLEAILKHTQGIAAIIGTVRKNRDKGGKPLFNSAAVIENGKLLGYYDKWLLPTYDVFSESRYFEPGRSVGLFTLHGVRVGVSICEDIWHRGGFVSETGYPLDPLDELQKCAPDLVVNLSASPYSEARPITRVAVCSKAAQALKCPVILAAQVGANDQLVFDGYSVVVDAQGELRALGKGFEEDELTIDLEALPPKLSVAFDPVENLFNALVLGIRDYFAKHGFKKACLGLSGGIDSAVTAVIAAHALGSGNVLAVTMPSIYSSKGSVSDSQELAKRLGISLLNIPIKAPQEVVINLLTPYFQGLAPDATEENIQARIRGLILMALSNKLGSVVLSTGNKSELAVGYATLYGDMCGGLGVLSDVTKTKVYALARWVNRKEEIIPQSIIDKPPSAELKPGQKDLDSLPDYAIVDAVLEGYVEEHLSIEAICRKERLERPLVEDLVRRIHVAEYKRRQAAPGIRVTRRAFSVGRHYPIVHKWL